MFELILSQGRVGDRAPRLIEGAARTAEAIMERYDVASRTVSSPSPPADDDWLESLPAARATLTGMAQAVKDSLSAGRSPVIVASTCSSGLATMPVVAHHHPGLCVLYVDGHGDFNTPGTTGTGYLGGMVLAGVCGLWESEHGAGVDGRRAVLVGARDIDAEERALILDAGVTLLPPSDATPERVRQATGDGPIWIHIDWDVLDPGHVPADYTVPDGMLPDQLRAVLAALPRDRVVGIEIGEFQPTGDPLVDHQATDTILHIIEPVLNSLADAEQAPAAGPRR